jgi:ankyrin repeat protein
MQLNISAHSDRVKLAWTMPELIVRQHGYREVENLRQIELLPDLPKDSVESEIRQKIIEGDEGNALRLIGINRRQLNPNLQDETGNTLLHHAANLGMLDVIHALTDNPKGRYKKTDVNKANISGETPLLYAMLNNSHQTQPRHNLHEVMRTLLLAGASTTRDIINHEGMMPFHTAALRGDVKAMRTLRMHNASPHLLNRQGHSLVAAAILGGNEMCVHAALSYGVDPMIHTYDGQSCRQMMHHFSVINQPFSLNAYHLLIDAMLSSQMLAAQQKPTASYDLTQPLPSDCEDKQILLKYLRHGFLTPDDPLFYVCTARYGQLHKDHYTVATEGTIEHELIITCLQRDEQTAFSILQQHPDLDLTQRTSLGDGVLTLCIQAGLPSMTSLLANVCKGRSDIVNAGNCIGMTPLMMSALTGNTPALKELLMAGANPLTKNIMGMTARDMVLLRVLPAFNDCAKPEADHALQPVTTNSVAQLLEWAERKWEQPKQNYLRSVSDMVQYSREHPPAMAPHKPILH